MKSLRSFNISSKAFQSATSFKLTELEALETVEIGGECFDSASSFSLIGKIEWMKWEIDLPLLQSVKLGDYAFRLTGSFAMSNLTSLQSIEFGQWCFGGTYDQNKGQWIGGSSSFSLIGIIERMKWEIDLPLLQSVKLGDYAFKNTRSFAMSNLTSLQSIEFGGECFNSASSFSLIGKIEWMKWEIDLPQLQSVKLGGRAFRYTKSFAMSNLNSLQSIEFGEWCFGGREDEFGRLYSGASSFSLIGIIEIMKWEIDLPQLQSVKLGEGAFRDTGSFAMSNLTSLQSIEFGSRCFDGHSEKYIYQNWEYIRYVGGAQYFALRGMTEWFKWIDRNSSTSLG